MPTPSASRDALLERTVSLYRRHFALWMAVQVPVVATAALLAVAAAALVARALPDSPAPQVAAAARAIPRVIFVAWVVAGVVGAQTVALGLLRGSTSPPSVGVLLTALASRLAGTLATTMVVLVHVAALGALGAGAAAALAWLPLGVLPALGASDGTARSVALLVLLPLLVIGTVPVAWWVARHALAIPLQTRVGGSAWAALGAARRATRGHAGAVLGLLIVTAVASNVFVLLCRAAGSLATLLIAPDRFRPIFGDGPLQSAAGADVQLGATLVATFLAWPLIVMPLAVLDEWLCAPRSTPEPLSPDP